MANILDYIFWRGDIDFSRAEFNEVDALILCSLSYARFYGLITSDFKKKDFVTLQEAESRFSSSPDFVERSQICSHLSQETVGLLQTAAQSERFGNLLVGAHVDVLDTVAEEQFSATTFISDDWAFIAFRGTDDTIVGWKEDFNLGVKDVVPAQRDALEYLENAAKNIKGTIYVGGHSKGGNLSLYAASHASYDVKKRIGAVFNNDGPGFKKDFFVSGDYRAIRDRVHSFVPELSVVGMLFDHDDRFVTVASDGKGIMQHDPFTWYVGPGCFEELPDTNSQSKFLGATINGWFNELSLDQKELFIETVFGILSHTDASTNSELSENWWNSVTKMVKAAAHLDSKTREAVMKTVHLLIKSAWENAPEQRV